MNPEAVERLLAALSEVLGKRVVILEEQPCPQPPAAVPVPAPLRRRTTLEDVKLAILNAQKRMSSKAVQRVVMAHGGKERRPDGRDGPSVRALPKAQWKACIAALMELPTR